MLAKLNSYCASFTSLNQESALSIVEWVRDNFEFVKVNYENPRCLERRTDFRIILSALRSRADYNDEFVRHCAGLVIQIAENSERDAVEARVVCYPAEDVLTDIPLASVEKNLERYTISELEDGTSVNLYYFTPQWRARFTDEEVPPPEGVWTFATRNSVDAGKIVWRGHSYDFVISDCLKTAPEFNYDLLDKKQTYSFGFRHPLFHPFHREISCWAITPTPGLAPQRVLSPEEVAGAVSRLETALVDFTEGKPAFMGLVLRSKTPAGEKTNFILQSKLYLKIREYFYNPPTRSPAARKLNGDLTYVLLYNYLDTTRRNMFIKLFPCFAARFRAFDDLRNRVAELICHVKKSGGDDKAQAIADFLRGKITSTKIHIVKDLICKPRYISIYYENLKV